MWVGLGGGGVERPNLSIVIGDSPGGKKEGRELGLVRGWGLVPLGSN